MNDQCKLATRDHIGAFWIWGRLILWATGMKPTPCHRVRFQETPLTVFPPEFKLVTCAGEGMCLQVLTRYEYSEAFVMAYPESSITVHHEGGSDQVEVTHVQGGSFPGLPPDRAALMAGGAATAGAEGAETGAVGPFAIRLGSLFESRNTDDVEVISAAERQEATGYSDSFSFDEAFADALKKLPPDPDPYPDKMTFVRVQEVGGIFGGIAGISRMFVRISA